MMCKSLKSARINRLLPPVTALLFLAALTVRAQQPSPSPSPRPAQAYVRFWNMLPNKDAPSLQLFSGENKLLTTAVGSNYAASYNPIAPGTYTFEIRKAGDTANPLKKQPVILRGDTYITYLVSQKNGQTAVELIDDTLDPKNTDGPSRLVVRQFIPGAQVTVTTRDGNTSQAVGYGESTALEVMPNRVSVMTLKATGLGPEPSTWNIETDFTTARHATVLVVADPYGRFRPRLTYDGQASSTPPPRHASPTRP